MDLQLITENIRTRLNIDQLNGIQRKMLQCDSPAIILIAPTGSGKTLAFAARMLTYLDSPSQRVQGLVLAPSRELVIQIAEIIRKIASGYKTVALYGGHSVIDEKNSLNPVPDIIVATPGRLLDHLQRGHIEIIRPEVLDFPELFSLLLHLVLPNKRYNDNSRHQLHIQPLADKAALSNLIQQNHHCQ